MALSTFGRDAGYMNLSGSDGLRDLLRDRHGAVTTAEALRFLSPSILRWRLTSGRWQQVCHGVVVVQSGPLSATQQLWAALLWGGKGALLAGLTAASLEGLHGFTEPGIHLLLPATTQVRKEPIRGSPHALSELDLADLLRRFGIPEPDRQASRRDQHGRRRWLDAVWEAARLIVEVDGRWPTDVATWWEDMQRDNEFTISGYRVLRFPAHAIRSDPA